jgi:hypothetical protein
MCAHQCGRRTEAVGFRRGAAGGGVLEATSGGLQAALRCFQVTGGGGERPAQRRRLHGDVGFIPRRPDAANRRESTPAAGGVRLGDGRRRRRGGVARAARVRRHGRGDLKYARTPRSPGCARLGDRRRHAVLAMPGLARWALAGQAAGPKRTWVGPSGSAR